MENCDPACGQSALAAVRLGSGPLTENPAFDLLSFSIIAIVCINQRLCAESLTVGTEQMLARRRS